MVFRIVFFIDRHREEHDGWTMHPSEMVNRKRRRRKRKRRRKCDIVVSERERERERVENLSFALMHKLKEARLLVGKGGRDEGEAGA